MLFEVTGINRHAETRWGDAGAVQTERVTVELSGVHTVDRAHPNRQIWEGVVSGCLTLADLAPAVAALYRLHEVVWVDVVVDEEEKR